MGDVRISDAVLVTQGIETVPVGNFSAGRRHRWSTALRSLSLGDEAECPCGLRVRRVSGDRKTFEGLNGEWPSECNRKE